MKEMLAAERNRGATVIFSTHVLSDFEETCDNVALIADSPLLLFGDLASIKRSRGANAVLIDAPSHPDSFKEHQIKNIRSFPARQVESNIDCPIR